MLCLPLKRRGFPQSMGTSFNSFASYHRRSHTHKQEKKTQVTPFGKSRHYRFESQRGITRRIFQSLVHHLLVHISLIDSHPSNQPRVESYGTSVNQSVHSSVCLFIHSFIRPSVTPFVPPSIHQSIHQREQDVGRFLRPYSAVTGLSKRQPTTIGSRGWR